MKRIYTLIGSYFIVLFSFAQNINPGQDAIFRTDEVATVYLTISTADSISLHAEENWYNDDYYPAQFRFVNSLMDTELTMDVGVRLRGNTSRMHPKKSYKINFRTFGGSRFVGNKHFNLKAENNDPSFLREHMSLQTFREAGVAAARSHHVQLFLNGEYVGLYLNVEQINDDFVLRRFDDDDGNLYKCRYGSSLKADNDVYNEGVFELKTNENQNDRSILHNFIQDLNSVPPGQFEEFIEADFEVDRFLKYLAVEAIVGHWDGYSYNQNNFYLYENTKTNRIEFIPYDLDNTFGIDWIPGDWARHDVLNWATTQDARPLANRILSRPKYFNQYAREIAFVLDEVFTTEQYFSQFDDYLSLLESAVEADAYFPLTFGFDMSDFYLSHTQGLGGHLPYGLKEYMNIRIESARAQISGTVASSTKAKRELVIYPNPNAGQQVYVMTEEPINQIRLYDMNGKEQAIASQQNGQFFLLTYDLPSGIYMLLIDGATHKLMVR